MRTRFAVLGLAATLVAGIAACNDEAFLTEVPRDFVGPEQFYRNAGDALAALSSVYAAFINGTGDNYYGRNFPMLVEYPTEAITSGRLGGTNERSLPDNFSLLPNHAYIDAVWTSAYFAINRANGVIDRVPAIDMDGTLKNRIVGEAKFLRALHYFNLVRLFGAPNTKLPLRLKEMQGLSDIETPPATAGEIYAAIVKDLNDAIPVLPKSYTGADYGRATVGAARTLLGKIYLQRGGTGVGAAVDFDSARIVLRQVMDSGGYTLVTNVMTLWDFYGGTVNEKNGEVIFDIQNSRAPGLGGRMSSHMAPNLTAPFLGAATNGSMGAELNFFNSYAANDARRNATWLLSWNQGTKVNTWTQTSNTDYASQVPFPRKYLDVQMPSTGAEEPNYVLLRYADVLLMLAEALNEVSGPTPEAIGYVNQVRTRAAIAGVPSAGMTAAQFKDSIFLERRKELVAEGHGHFDSQRHWNWAKARIEANLVLGRSANNATNGTGGNRYPRANSSSPCTGTPGTCTLTDKYRFYPIPQRAIDVSNGKLTQNPLW